MSSRPGRRSACGSCSAHRAGAVSLRGSASGPAASGRTSSRLFPSSTLPCTGRERERPASGGRLGAIAQTQRTTSLGLAAQTVLGRTGGAHRDRTVCASINMVERNGVSMPGKRRFGLNLVHIRPPEDRVLRTPASIRRRAPSSSHPGKGQGTILLRSPGCRRAGGSKRHRGRRRCGHGACRSRHRRSAPRRCPCRR